MKITHTPAAVLIAGLRFYKRFISPAFLPSCRYTPTCSEYAIEAVDQYGALYGSVLAIWRLLRCHPFVRGGYDPLPVQRHPHHCRASFGRSGEGARPHMA